MYLKYIAKSIIIYIKGYSVVTSVNKVYTIYRIMKILLDAFGGDYAPAEMVKGAVMAVQNDSEVEVVLVGNEDAIKAELAPVYTGDKISIINADEVIGCDEVPTVAIRQKPNSSMVVALNALRKNDEYVGMVSSGSTGALLTGAYLIVRRIKGIQRPALCPILPTIKGGKVILCDAGANADCKAEMLCDFALMADKYATIMNGVTNPKIAILSNGAEEGKGNEMTKAAYSMLKEMKGINFVGNIEARDIISGDVDIVVADGFSGNVALKATEGMAMGMLALIKDGIMNGGVKAKLGYVMLKKVFKDVKHTLDYNENGGAMFIGVEKVVVKAHGSAKAKSIANSIIQAKDLAKRDVIGKIKEALLEAKEG